MRRRALLSTFGTALLAGCNSDGSNTPFARSRATSTPTYAGTVLTEPKPVPEPPETVTPGSAERFVREYERAVVYNELLPGHSGESDAGVEVRPDGCAGAKSITVEDPTTRVLLADGPGVFVAAAVSGHVERACPGSGTSGGTRNRNFVTHYVGPDRHVTVPYNFYGCDGRAEPYAGSGVGENVPLDADDDGRRERAPAKIQLYDFHPDDHAVAVWLTHVDSGDRVLAETYETGLPLTVVANLAVRTGTYRLTASLDDGTNVTREFDLAGPTAATWHGICVYLTPREALRVIAVESTDDLVVPGSLCRDHLERGRTGTPT